MALPATFAYAQARAAGMSKHALYRLRDTGHLEQLLQLAARFPRVETPLRTALRILL